MCTGVAFDEPRITSEIAIPQHPNSIKRNFGHYEYCQRSSKYHTLPERAGTFLHTAEGLGGARSSWSFPGASESVAVLAERFILTADLLETV